MFHKKRFFFLTEEGRYSCLTTVNELHAVKPSSLSELRAKSASPACIKKYFDELGKILKKYDLCDKPHLIYNVE
jgi:hypothetical protein